MIGHEFIVVTDLYDRTGDGELVLIKKDIKTKWYCRDISEITDVEQTCNVIGNLRIHHSKIRVHGEDKIVKMSYNKVKTLLDETNKIGFNR